MRPLAAAELLDVWEQGLSAPLVTQALLLLTAACSDYTRDALTRLPIGHRDALLLKLRDWTFGTRLTSVVDCPQCGERLEIALDSGELQLAAGEASPETLYLQAEGYGVTYRLPNTLDLMALVDAVTPETRMQALLGRCLIEARDLGMAGENQHAEQTLALEHLPEPVVEAMRQQMSEADPLGDVRFALACPSCDHRWSALFDIVSFFWREIDDWARRTLREVTLLARAYGWSEADILALSAWRRRAYLEMIA